MLFFASQKYQSGKKCNIYGRHLLTGENDAAVHSGLLALFVLVHIHLASSVAAPTVFQHLNLLDVDAVLEFINMDVGVADAGYGIGQGRDGSSLNVQRFVVRSKE